MLTSVAHTGPHERDKKRGSSELVRVENSWVQSAMVKPFLVLRFAYLTSMSLGWREHISEYAKILVVQGSSRNARAWHCHNGYTRKRHLFVTLATYVPCVHPISVVLIRLTRTPSSWFVVGRRLKLDAQPTDLFHLTQTLRGLDFQAHVYLVSSATVTVLNCPRVKLWSRPSNNHRLQIVQSHSENWSRARNPAISSPLFTAFFRITKSTADMGARETTFWKVRSSVVRTVASVSTVVCQVVWCCNHGRSLRKS